MTHNPRTEEEVYDSFKESLANKTEKLTNFTERSFNYLWTVAFSKEIRNLEVLTVVSEMAGWIDYVGGDITQSDLEELDLDGRITPAEINSVMEDDYLDQYVKILGIERFEGTEATGTVTIETQSAQTDIPSGTIVSTPPDNNGNTKDFVTTEYKETVDGKTTVTGVPIEADEIGDEYNVPADTIVRFGENVVGVRSVTNPEATTGGESRESNEDLRARAKSKIEGASEGGTVEGIKAYLRQNLAAIGEGDVIIDEFTESDPPFVEVIVDGGSDTDVQDAINESRPTGIRHDLVRPTVIQFGVDVKLQGSDISKDVVSDTITSFLIEFGIGENFYRDELIRQIMNSDENITNIRNLDITYDRVTRDSFKYDTNKSDYKLSLTYDDVNGSISVEDNSGDIYDEGVDFEVQNQTADSFKETLVWLNNQNTEVPDQDDTFFVDYDVTLDSTSEPYNVLTVRDEIKEFKKGITEQFTYDGDDFYKMEDVPFDQSTSINSGTYTEGTDYEIIDNNGDGLKQTIDWTIGGSTPSTNDTFTINYDKKVYNLDKEIVEDLDDQITDNSGNTYSVSTDFTLVDTDADGKNEAISWNTNPTDLNDNEEFYVRYKTTNDKIIGLREKMDPSTDRINVSVV